MIVSHLYDDRDMAALSALSLVSQDWQTPAQISLFEKLNVGHTYPRDTAGLLQIFEASPRLRFYVFRLVSPQGFTSSSFVIHGKLYMSQLLRLTALLPNLRSITLAYKHIISPPKTHVKRQSNHPFDLTLTGCFLNRGVFHALLASFSVQSLCTTTLSTALSLDTNTPPDNFSALHRLQLSAYELNKDWVSRQLLSSPLDHLRSLGIDHFLGDAAAVGLLQSFFRTTGRRVERLRINLRPPVWVPKIGGHAYLSVFHEKFSAPNIFIRSISSGPGWLRPPTLSMARFVPRTMLPVTQKFYLKSSGR